MLLQLARQTDITFLNMCKDFEYSILNNLSNVSPIMWLYRTLFFFNFLEIYVLLVKCSGHKMCVSFFYKTFVWNIFRSEEYFESRAQVIAQKHAQLFVLSSTGTAIARRLLDYVFRIESYKIRLRI
jgi:hypothetical protein